MRLLRKLIFSRILGTRCWSGNQFCLRNLKNSNSRRFMRSCQTFGSLDFVKSPSSPAVSLRYCSKVSGSPEPDTDNEESRDHIANEKVQEPHGHLDRATQDPDDDGSRDHIESEKVEKEKRDRLIAEYYEQYERDLLDAYEKGSLQEVEPISELKEDRGAPISDQRGIDCVIDLEELIDILYWERGVDVCCIKIAKEANYADYMVLCSAYSPRHLRALRDAVARAYKKKAGPKDPPLRVEGKDTARVNREKLPSTWQAMDLGSIVVHIMMAGVREKYDLESLWALGPELDDLVTAKVEADSLEELLMKFSQPLDDHETKLVSK